jgi:integron integrase
MVSSSPTSNKRKLLDQVRDVIRRKHYSIRTEQAYCDWIKRFILFHDKRHPAEMAESEVTEFLTYLAVKENVAAATQNQALSALLFLYREVLEQKIGWLDRVERAKKPARLPVVLTRAEVRRIFSHLHGTTKLMAGLLYGSGLRLLECVRLRVKDVDFAYARIAVRDGKGAKDRVTMLPVNLAESLQRHLAKVKAQHEQDLADGFGRVYLPHALARKFPNADREWRWQYVFPSARLSINPRSEIKGESPKRRHHIDESALQLAVKNAVRASGVHKPATCHTLRHSFATH